MPTNEEIIKLVRQFLGGIDVEELPDEIIALFWNKWTIYFDVPANPARFATALYNTVVDCVRWLIVQESANGNSEVTERFEKIGDETISVKGGSSIKSWQDFLDWLLLNPNYIDPSLPYNSSLIIIGGVRQDRYFSAKNNFNSRNGFMEQGVYPTPGIPTRSPWGPVTGRWSPWLRGTWNK